jgi:hypothetical protein
LSRGARFYTSGFYTSGFYTSGFYTSGFYINGFYINGFCTSGFCTSGGYTSYTRYIHTRCTHTSYTNHTHTSYNLCLKCSYNRSWCSPDRRSKSNVKDKTSTTPNPTDRKHIIEFYVECDAKKHPHNILGLRQAKGGGFLFNFFSDCPLNMEITSSHMGGD